jgi:DNA adenine methylase
VTTELILDVERLSERAAQRNSALPRPFLKWAGSKQALLSKLLGVLPKSFGTYFEPFLGSGALFFCLEPNKAYLNDKCADLIATYKTVRDEPAAVIGYLNKAKPNRTAYYSVREHRSRGPIKRAAEFIYLNKLCWNGLYRVNSRGVFNVPYGDPGKSPQLFDSKNIRACSEALNKAKLSCKDFEFVQDLAQESDLVFFDPPYVTKHNNNGFRDWNETLFSWKDQKRLAATAQILRKRGVHVIVSNANHNDVIKLYSGFKKKKIFRSTTLASSSDFRGLVSEIVLYATE